MFLSKATETSIPLVDRASQAADQVIKSTQNVATQTVDKLAGAMQDLRDDTLPVLNHAVEGVSAFAHRGVDSMRDASHQLRVKAEHASESTASYIRHDPLKSVLIAAATGAALMALVSLLSRNRDRR
jgi:ElaB/YqjD/DUF883 family membrane-anchored ribosome-binding protein